MENEKILIVVPVYKVEAYLDRCISSILNQTYVNWELILVDDGSPDNCPAICDRLGAEYDNITVIHQENGGLSAARNTGIEYAREHGDENLDWITFIDSDDFVHPRYLEYLYRAAKEANVRISSCNCVCSSDTELLSAPVAPFKYYCITPETHWSRNFTNATVAWGKLYQMRLFEEIRYPVGLLFEDNFTTYRLLFQLDTIAVIWTPLYCWFANPDSITRSVWSPEKLAVLDALEEQVVFFRNHGFPEAVKSSAQELMRHSTRQYMYIRHLSPQYDHLLKAVCTRRSRAFRLYAREAGLKKAFADWFAVGIKGPVQRVLRQESAISFLKRRIKKKLRLK